ncbi:WAS/WASL-interacting protein family member 2-like isoform X2 [Cyprinus carpio]|uniref:WAS/WASL-interacting protein family member 2-like isoform X2 n=1 Tax=Cyprinus carpio TaxID=7962 RepID=A0A9Q9YDB9_CYPCA|nr:WAS/WASL-interacting protein family member 2-like isoform X2 [Cyprinus carpio]
MASMQDGVNFSAHPYGKVLLLGAIAAASAFVVTILIVVLCVGCQRKGKTHNGPGEERKHRLMDMSILRQSKLTSIKSSKKNRPASMDLLLLPSRRSNSDLRSQGRQLPQIPSGEDGEHTYAEVGRRSSPTRGSEDARYGVGGRAGETDTPAPPAVPANTPAPPDPDGDCLEGGIPESETLPQVVNTPPQPQETVEYACIRKVRRVDKAAQKRDNGTETEEGLGQQQRHSSGEIRNAPPTHPAPPPTHPHSQKIPRKNMDTFNLPSFPKEAVFMGNGEQYIWKPPEEDDIIFQHKQMGILSSHAGENMAASAAGITEMYSKVCKPGKKKRGMPGSPTAARDISGFRTLARGDRGERDGGFSVVVKPQTWAPQEGKGTRAPPGSMEDHCYEAISTEETELAYETMEGGGGWRRDRPPPNASATLRPKRKRPQQPLQQPPPPPPPHPPPPPPPQQTPKLQNLPAKTMLIPGESLYESIPDLKQGSATSSTTTIFTFNDGMEMYVTGL